MRGVRQGLLPARAQTTRGKREKRRSPGFATTRSFFSEQWFSRTAGAKAACNFSLPTTCSTPTGASCSRGAEAIAVEPQVFDLLIYLVQNRDRVVTKDDLIATVWRGRIVSESTLTSRINAARKAVGDSGAGPGG